MCTKKKKDKIIDKKAKKPDKFILSVCFYNVVVNTYNINTVWLVCSC